MQVMTDPLKIHDAGQAARQTRILKSLVERDPETRLRVGSRRLLQQTADLLRLYTIPDSFWLPGGAR